MREYLKSLRKEKNISQLSLGKILNISESYYNQIENGRRQNKMDLPMISKLAEAFNVPVEQLIAEEQKLQSTAS